MFNNVTLVGRLTRDPELRFTNNGTAVCNFTLAVDQDFVKENGERDADFIDIVVWRKMAEACADNLGKGRLVLVNGRLSIRSYEDKNGIRRKASEIVARTVKFLDWPKDKKNGNGSSKRDTSDTPKNVFGETPEDLFPGEIEWPDDPPF